MYHCFPINAVAKVLDEEHLHQQTTIIQIFPSKEERKTLKQEMANIHRILYNRYVARAFMKREYHDTMRHFVMTEIIEADKDKAIVAIENVIQGQELSNCQLVHDNLKVIFQLDSVLVIVDKIEIKKKVITEIL